MTHVRRLGGNVRRAWIAAFLLALAVPLPACGGGGTGPRVATPEADVPMDPGPAPEPPPLPPVPETSLWPLFEDVTVAAGIAAPHGVVSDYWVTGQAWADVDGDRLLDLYVTNSTGPNLLYRNRGDGGFESSAHTSTVALPAAVSGGAIFADYDNDGWSDLYVLNKGPNALFRNLEGQGFEDVTSSARVGDDGVGSTASWGDYDRDGHLDLYVANWGTPVGVPKDPGDIYLGKDRLYHNEGNGTFKDVSDLLGEFERTGYGYVASFVDYDDDGDPDIYLTNDFGYPGDPVLGQAMNRNVLWRNDGNGPNGWVFSEVALDVGAAAAGNMMGVAIGDYDGDLDLDVYVTDIGVMRLLVNQGDATFHDVWTARDAGIEAPGFGWGCVFSDFDLDGWLDLYVARGDRASAVFLNQADGTFLDVSDESGAAHAGYTMGVAHADYDRDGWVDLVVGDYGTDYRLYRNRGRDTGRESHVLVVRLVGGGPVNRDAVGGRVVVTRTDGLVMMREVVCGSSLGAGSDLALHFGLGDARVEEMKVVWPNGEEQTFTEVPIDMEVLIRYTTE